jgi:hypothetical protein
MACTVYPVLNGPRLHKGFPPHCLTLGAGAGRLDGHGLSLGPAGICTGYSSGQGQER